MTRIRVGGSIARAYSFFFTRILSIVGFSWLPGIFLAALTWWWLTRLSASGALLFAGAGPPPRLIGETLGFALVALLLASTIAVPLSRLALGENVEGAAARFAVGARELRFFLALLRFGAVVLTALMIFGVGLAALVEAGLIPQIAGVMPGATRFSAESGGHWHGIPIRILVLAAAAVSAVAMVTLLAARLGLLLLPVAAAESEATLTRAAALSRGNTWRLLFVCAALAVPVLALLVASEFLVLGPPVRANLLHALSAGMPDRALEILGSHALAIGAVVSVAMTAFLSLVAGASAAAYGDRRYDVPVQSPVSRREPRDTRGVTAPLIDVGRAPAFAKIHPLATLLPSEMPTSEAHAEVPTPVKLAASHETDATASQTTTSGLQPSNPAEYFQPAENNATSDPALAPAEQTRPHAEAYPAQETADMRGSGSDSFGARAGAR